MKNPLSLSNMCFLGGTRTPAACAAPQLSDLQLQPWSGLRISQEHSQIRCRFRHLCELAALAVCSGRAWLQEARAGSAVPGKLVCVISHGYAMVRFASSHLAPAPGPGSAVLLHALLLLNPGRNCVQSVRWGCGCSGGAMCPGCPGSVLCGQGWSVGAMSGRTPGGLCCIFRAAYCNMCKFIRAC